MSKSPNKKIVTSLLIVASLAVGCATTGSLASRKQERLAAYEALTPDMRDAVDHGNLKAGMNTNAVFIAWGNPSQVTRGGDATGERTMWVYEGGYVQETRFWGGYRMHYGYTPLVYTRATVTFVNDAVKEWQTYPTPNY